MSIYTPPRKIRKDIDAVIAGVDSKPFYDYHDNLKKNKSPELTLALSTEDSLSKNPATLLSILEEVQTVSGHDGRVILGGLKDFFRKQYTEEEFERAAHLLGQSYPNNSSQDSAVFRVLKQAIMISFKEPRKNVASLYRRFQMLFQAWKRGMNSKSNHEKSCAIRYGFPLLYRTENEVAEARAREGV